MRVFVLNDFWRFGYDSKHVQGQPLKKNERLAKNRFVFLYCINYLFMYGYLKHVVFWSLYSLFLFVVFNLLTDTTTALIRSAAIIITQALFFYVNTISFLPKFYETKKYFMYTFLNVGTTFLGVFCNNFVTEFASYGMYDYSLDEDTEVMLEENYMDDMVYYNGIDIFDIELMFTHAMPIVLAIFISFFMYTFQQRKKQEEKELAIAMAEKNFLIQQINPHFLFNTLNNIYFLTYQKAPKGAKAVMQLSKMLDYSLYGEKEGKVSLKEEIDYINNFINLFKLKDSFMNNITFDYSKAITTQRIAPMLLLPFVENAFKHGNLEDTEKGFVTIVLASEANAIKFDCVNSYKIKKVVDKTGGIGIANVSRRLELLYPNKHQLDIVQKMEKEYRVHLKIDINV